MSWIQRRDEIQAELRKIDKSIIVCVKEGRFWAALSWVLQPVISREEFMTRYATTFGPLQAYPPGYSYDDVMKVGRHECKHTAQARVCGWFVPVLGWIPQLAPWVGLPIMAVLYGLIPVPCIFAGCRYLFELAAEAELWRYMLQSGATQEDVFGRAERSAEKLWTKYGWTMPKPLLRWGFRRKAIKVVAEALA